MKISIITATLNNEATISECIASVNEQTYPDIEHIIIDGVSADNTVKIINSMPNRVSRLISEPDQGIYSALNKGINMANGNIIGFLHADDTFYEPDTIQKIVFAIQMKKVDGIYGDLIFIRENEIVRKWNSKPFNGKNVKYGWAPPHPTLFLKNEVYNKTGLFDSSFRISGDYDFMLRIFRNPDFTFAHLPEIITKMMIGGASTGNFKKTRIKWEEDLRAIRNNKIRFPYLALISKKVRKFNQLI